MCATVREKLDFRFIHVTLLSYENRDNEIVDADRDKIVVYTTSLGYNRALLAKCQRAMQIVRGLEVRYEERDIFNYEHHKIELWRRLGLESGPFPVERLHNLIFE